MAKLYTYTVLMLGIIFLLSLAGMPVANPVLDTFGLSNGGGTLGSSSFIAEILKLLATAAGVGAVSAILVGFFTRTSFEFIFLAGFAGANLFFLISTFTGIINYASGFAGWIYFPIYAIFGVLAVGYIFAVIDWVFNRGGT